MNNDNERGECPDCGASIHPEAACCHPCGFSDSLAADALWAASEEGAEMLYYKEVGHALP